ncbi:DUF202 domain-containing protein [Streptomyces zingiberis]|uniref:DUF202 domain-containing protein n=1 Tax=Streptomyces zingiberis TaxID=2053010 RepID=A0ABX1BY06_9ACTN|nr:DUF202 domain-containing protein [Streptomyces zingiberis]NJQ01370.1 DUF202 domain-containing protein [Streptomyces zingiberis]
MTEAHPRDPAAQPERTRLAWRRSTLAASVTALLAARLALREGAHPAGLLAAALVAAAWLLLLATAHRRIRALAVPRPDAAPARTLALATGCAVATAVCGALLLR